MVRAEINTASGMKIVVDGTSEEVNAVVAYVKSREGGTAEKHAPREIEKKSRSGKKNLSDLILALRDEGFFDSPKNISEVKTALDEKAHFYPLPSVSTRLIRLVRRGEMGRVKSGSKWTYVKR